LSSEQNSEKVIAVCSEINWHIQMKVAKRDSLAIFADTFTVVQLFCHSVL